MLNSNLYPTGLKMIETSVTSILSLHQKEMANIFYLKIIFCRSVLNSNLYATGLKMFETPVTSILSLNQKEMPNNLLNKKLHFAAVCYIPILSTVHVKTPQNHQKFNIQGTTFNCSIKIIFWTKILIL